MHRYREAELPIEMDAYPLGGADQCLLYQRHLVRDHLGATSSYSVQTVNMPYQPG